MGFKASVETRLGQYCKHRKLLVSLLCTRPNITHEDTVLSKADFVGIGVAFDGRQSYEPHHY